MNGKMVDKVLDLPIKLYTQKNINEFDPNNLIYIPQTAKIKTIFT